MEAGRKFTHIIFQTLKEKTCQPYVLYSEKLSFRNEGGKRHYQKEYLEEFITSRHMLKQWLKKVLETEWK